MNAVKVNWLAGAALSLILAGLSCPEGNGGDLNHSPPSATRGSTAPTNVYLQATSVVDNSVYPDGNPACPTLKIPLYRGTGGGFFPLPRVLKNMLGHTAAEYPSWRLTAKIKEQGFKAGQEPTLEAMEILRLDAATDLKEQLAKHEKTWNDPSKLLNGRKFLDYGPFKKCVLYAQDAEEYTWEDQPIEKKSLSWGVAVMTDYVQVLQYAADPVKPARLAKYPGEFTIIQVVEKVPRAGLLTSSRRKSNKGVAGSAGLFTLGGTWPGREAYIPISVPAADIKQAWSARYTGGDHSHGLEKIENADGNVKEIRISRENGYPYAPAPQVPHSSGLIEGRVIPCVGAEPCVSDAVHGDLELKQIIDAIPAGKYRFVAGP